MIDHKCYNASIDGTCVVCHQYFNDWSINQAMLKNKNENGLSKEEITTSTQGAIDEGEGIILKALEYASDSDSSERRMSLQCKRCWYFRNGGVYGRAFTKANCLNCQKEVIYSSTNTNKLCEDCAENRLLCCKCGSKLNYR